MLFILLLNLLVAKGAKHRLASFRSTPHPRETDAPTQPDTRVEYVTSVSCTVGGKPQRNPGKCKSLDKIGYKAARRPVRDTAWRRHTRAGDADTL